MLPNPLVPPCGTTQLKPSWVEILKRSVWSRQGTCMGWVETQLVEGRPVSDVVNWLYRLQLPTAPTNAVSM